MPFLNHAAAKLHYQVIGSGPKVLLAFHGYGQDSHHFGSIGEVLGDDYTIYAFDLFFHGKSALPKNQVPLQKQLLAVLIEQLLEKEQIERFSVMGFSMGGKFALSLTESFPEKMDALFLIAPDGIGTSFWYNVATYPGWLQGLFKQTVLKPKPFFRMVNILHYTNVVDKSLLRFTRGQMNSLQNRLRVYRSWVAFRELTFDIRKIISLLNLHHIPVTVFLGQYDKVIPRRRLQVFLKALAKGSLIILEAGHSRLLPEVALYLHKHHLPKP